MNKSAANSRNVCTRVCVRVGLRRELRQINLKNRKRIFLFLGLTMVPDRLNVCLDTTIDSVVTPPLLIVFGLEALFAIALI